MVSVNLEPYLVNDKSGQKTSIVHLFNQEYDKSIDLYAMVHFANPRYYEEILSRLERLYRHETLGRVLYEDADERVEFHEQMAKRLTECWATDVDKGIEKLIKGYPDDKEIFEKARILLKHTTQIVAQTSAIDYNKFRRDCFWIMADLPGDDLFKGLGMNTYGYLALKSIARRGGNLGLRMADWAEEQAVHTKKFQEKQKQREQKVYDSIERWQNDELVQTFAVLYGAEHMARLETELTRRGYARKKENPVEYLVSQTTTAAEFEKFKRDFLGGEAKK
jgi:hypothetical protein